MVHPPSKDEAVDFPHNHRKARVQETPQLSRRQRPQPRHPSLSQINERRGTVEWGSPLLFVCNFRGFRQADLTRRACCVHIPGGKAGAWKMFLCRSACLTVREIMLPDNKTRLPPPPVPVLPGTRGAVASWPSRIWKHPRIPQSAVVGRKRFPGL
jgi:hypothetical protein